MMKPIALCSVFAVATLAACAATPANDPTGSANRNVAALPTNIILAPGGSVEVLNANLSIRFDSITADSRCPADVQCVQAGEATAAFTVAKLSGTMTAQLLTLSTRPAKDTITSYGQRLQLVNVTPATLSTSQIPKSAYRVELKVGTDK